MPTMRSRIETAAGERVTIGLPEPFNVNWGESALSCQRREDNENGGEVGILREVKSERPKPIKR